jgi:hypothetical protein
MDVFISYNRADLAHANVLRVWLASQQMKPFLDTVQLESGKMWLPELERQIETGVAAVAVLVGPHGLGNTQQYEYSLALTRQAREPDFPVIPVILPGTEPHQLPRGFLSLQTWADFRGAHDLRAAPAELQRLLAAIRRERPDGDGVHSTICPYKGLEAFAEEDCGLFFGREAEAEALHQTVVSHRLAAVIGRSGSGKSSLARAGLLPRLRRRGAAGWDTIWDTVVIRPGSDPLLALASALSVAPAQEDSQDRFFRLQRQAESWRQPHPGLPAGPLAHYLRHHLDQARPVVTRLLILVDQAEELFSRPWHLPDAASVKQFEADAARFIALLQGAVTAGVASLVLTIRSDYFDPLMHSPFAGDLKDGLVQLGHIRDLRPCIERPAAAVGLRFAPKLVERIMQDVGEDESNLPLLQHALQRTWAEREGAVLTDSGYARAGGVAQAINLAAQSTYDALPAEERQAAQRFFLRLVRPGDGRAHLRVRAPVPEDLLERKVMEAFAAPDRRLVFVGRAEGRRVVEVAHEALVRGWPTLLEWVETSRERLRTRDDILHWLHQTPAGSQPELLPPGALLQRGRDLLRDPGLVPIDDIAGFVTSSVRRDRLRRRRGVAALGSLVVVFAALSATSVVFWRRSEAALLRAEDSLALATKVNLFLTKDLLGRATPRNTGKPDETVMEAAANAEPMIDQRFHQEPAIEAAIYAALAHAYTDRSAVAQARHAYKKAVAAYETAQGPDSADAAIVRSQWAMLEADQRSSESIAAASALVTEADHALPHQDERHAAVLFWIETARGWIAMANGDGLSAVKPLQDAVALAATQPASFDADSQLIIRFRLGEALIFAGRSAEARDILAAVEREARASHGRRFAFALIVGVQLGQALDLSGEPEKSIGQIDAIYPDLVSVLGARHEQVLVALASRADAENNLGRYTEAAHDEQQAYDLALALRGPKSFGAINAMSGLATAQCRDNQAQAGLATSAQMVANAAQTFGATHPLTQAFGLTRVQCLVVAGQYSDARAYLLTLNRESGAKALGDPYPGMSYDVLDAITAFHVGDAKRAAQLLPRLKAAFSAGSADKFFEAWIKQLAAELGHE